MKSQRSNVGMSNESTFSVDELSDEDSRSQGKRLGDASSSAGDSSIGTPAGASSVGLAHQETKWLRCSKMIFLLILMVAAALSTFAVYRISRKEESDAYKVRFEDFANEVIAVSELRAEAVVESYDTLSRTITSSVNASAWPNVVVSGFEGHTRPLLEYTDANFVSLTPLVFPDKRAAYEEFILGAAPGWIQEAADYAQVPVEIGFAPFIYNVDAEGNLFPGIPEVTAYSPEEPYYLPVHQASPIENFAASINYNVFTNPFYLDIHNRVVSVKKATVSSVENEDGDPSVKEEWPAGYLATPVFRNLGRDDDIVGVLTGQIGFHAFLGDLLPEDVDPIYVVITNTCNQTFTYLIDGPTVTYVGKGDLHESRSGISVSGSFDAFVNLEDCVYTFLLYPSNSFYDSYHSNQPIINAVAIGATFVATAIIFILYDILVERRQNKVMRTASKSVAILSSLFPTNVRDRLLKDDSTTSDGAGNDRDKKKSHKSSSLASGHILNAPRGDVESEFKSKPIADLFPHVSVLFADIVGFTAWASMREPSQVFELLEAVYSSFDKLARKLKVFKVETIGDCYVAACGLPEPVDKHAVVMTRFAKACMDRMKQVVHGLASNLGPDTSNLTMRMGIHSGPVTAGVLRGEKSRFQLFGDTVNTAARIESSGIPGRIQISQETADALMLAGKGSLISARTDKVEAKGKGFLQTYWVIMEGSASGDSEHALSESGSVRDLTSRSPAINADDLSLEDDTDETKSDMNSANNGPGRFTATKGKSNELEIAWNADVMKSLLKKIISMRSKTVRSKTADVDYLEARQQDGCEHIYALDEVKEVIFLPNKPAEYVVEPETVELSARVVSQIDDYVLTIASMYRENPFHNFSHASHVVQSTMKLLNRIVAAEEIDYKDMSYRKQNKDARHKYSYGITSDPITQFACIFAALIHDVDHCGVPNSQLVKEKTRIAVTYNNKSVAEQNSLDLAWDLLMDDQYKDFRACIYTNEEEFQRFRQLLVNMVMATDIMDKDLKELRNSRWEKAFNKRNMSSADLQSLVESSTQQEDDNRMATIVIEHLIQASDVAHTMQHWHVYTRWNERLFHEMYSAYKMGRAETDPSENWYKGEMGFFDFYIIPLAKKLQECKIFGVSSDEYLNYAQANRKEWEARGQEMVQQYLSRYTGPQ